MKLLLPALAGALLVAAPAFAQDAPPPPGSPGNPIVSSQDYPSPGAGQATAAGVEGVNPAPGATGPYVGAGRHGFYDVGARIGAIEGRLGELSPGQRGPAASALRRIKSDAAFRRSRDGGALRDWDREFLNHKLDLLVRQYPGLSALG